jgi:hypothetical protein
MTISENFNTHYPSYTHPKKVFSVIILPAIILSKCNPRKQLSRKRTLVALELDHYSLYTRAVAAAIVLE